MTGPLTETAATAAATPAGSASATGVAEAMPTPAATATATTPTTAPTPDDACCHAHAQHGYSAQKDAYAKRLRRIEGQVRGIARMVDEDVYCIDILTQVSAATKALQTVAMGLVTDHMSHCVVDAARSSDEEAQAKVDEVAAAISRLLR